MLLLASDSCGQLPFRKLPRLLNGSKQSQWQRVQLLRQGSQSLTCDQALVPGHPQVPQRYIFGTPLSTQSLPAMSTVCPVGVELDRDSRSRCEGRALRPLALSVGLGLALGRRAAPSPSPRRWPARISRCRPRSRSQRNVSTTGAAVRVGVCRPGRGPLRHRRRAYPRVTSRPKGSPARRASSRSRPRCNCSCSGACTRRLRGNL